MNDFELDEIDAKIRKNESYELPRRVRFCHECKRIFVQKDQLIKVKSFKKNFKNFLNS